MADNNELTIVPELARVELLENGLLENRLPGNDASVVAGWTMLNPTGGDGPGTWGGESVVNLNGRDERSFGDGIEQTINTVPGGTYDFSIDLAEAGWGYGNHNVRIEILDADGNIVEEQSLTVHNGQSITSDFSFSATSTETTVRIINDYSTNSIGTDLLIKNVSVVGQKAEPVLTDDGLLTYEISHGADGTFEFQGATYYFQDRAADGTYFYGTERLTNDEKASYDLSQNDIEFLIKQAQLGVVEASELQDVSQALGIRELTGFGNNVENPLWGNADQLYQRLTKADYADGIGEIRDSANPRDVSNIIMNQNQTGNPNLFGPNAGAADSDLGNDFRANEFTWAFGQYFDHGLGFLPKGGTNADGTEAGKIFAGNASFPLTLTRGSVAEGTGIDSPREHVNQTSPFVDQNQAYGSTDEILEFLLERSDAGQFTGRLLSSADGGIPNLGEAKANWQKGVDAGLAEAIDWDAPDAISNFRGSGDALLLDVNPRIPLDLHLVAGDGRVNENAGLSVVHTIWKNNHNFWVEKLLEYFSEGDAGDGGARSVTLPDGLNLEHIFQMAKIINEGEYQRAVNDEYVELLVGSDVHNFRDYNPNINADITHEFAAAAYRLGHSMLNNTVTVADGDGNNQDIPLFSLFLNPIKFRELGATNLLDGMIDTLQQEIDSKIVTTMRNNLLGQPIDLASLNLSRGRDVGLPTLNDMREMSGLERYTDWDDFGSNLRYPSDLDKFKQAYGSVDEVDLWVGGLAEKPSASNAFGSNLATNSVMGETFAQVFSIQMIALQDGDRFYYKNRLFETELRLNIQSQDFADIVERTLGLEYLQADILKTIDNRLDFSDMDQTVLELSGTAGHDVIIGRDIGETIRGEGGDDTIFLKAGNDTAFGGDGDDAMHGGAGNDTLNGESGDDRADGGTGNDVIFGGSGDDDLSGNEGDDFIDGGENDDEVFGGAGNDQVFGGSGNDNVWGGLGNDLVQGGDGNDMVTGNDGNDSVYGGAGNDKVLGGEGDDYMEGGSGGDLFIILPGSGDDVIADFNVNEDTIDLHRYTWEYGRSLITVANLKADAVDSVNGLVLKLIGDASITLTGVTKSEFFNNAQRTLELEDRIEGREGLILDKQTGIVVDAGTRDTIIEDPVTGEITIIKAPDRDDFTVGIDDLALNGFGRETFVSEISFEDFSAGAIGWSNTQTGRGKDGDSYLGQFGGTARTIDTTKTFDMGTATSAVIEFDFLEIDSWDNEEFLMTVNGETINFGRFWNDKTYGDKVEGSNGSQNGISWSIETGVLSTTNFGQNDYWIDEVHKITVTAENVGSELELGFGSKLNQGVWNESWGVDNLKISNVNEVLSLRYTTVENQVSVETFTGGAQGWSNNKTGALSDGDQYLGGFGWVSGSLDTTKSYALSSSAVSATISFDFLEIDSWDNEEFLMTVNGETINIGNFWNDKAYGDKAEGSSGSQNGISWTVETGGLTTDNIGKNSYWSDEVHKVTVTTENVGSELEVSFGSSLNQNEWDESWGVDNLVITETVRTTEAADSGQISYTFDGEAGGYDVVVNSYDENDGLAAIEVLLNGDQMLYQVLDQDFGNNAIGPNNMVDVIAENLFIQDGDKVEIIGYSDNFEFVRIDGLEFLAINDPFETLFV